MRTCLLAMALCLTLGGCTERHAPTEPAKAAAPAPEPAPAPAEATDEPAPPPEPPKAEPKSLDDMTQAELEAACFAHDQRACDRLGH